MRGPGFDSRHRQYLFYIFLDKIDSVHILLMLRTVLVIIHHNKFTILNHLCRIDTQETSIVTAILNNFSHALSVIHTRLG